MELGEADQQPTLATPEQIGMLCYDMYFMSEKVFGSAFMNSPALTYYTCLTTDERIVGTSDDEPADLEVYVNAEIDGDTGQPYVDSYNFNLTTAEGSSIFPEYNVSSTIEYAIFPHKNKVEVKTTTGFAAKEGGVIIYDFADDESILRSLASKRRRRTKLSQLKSLNKQMSRLSQTDLDQLYDMMRALGYVEHQD